MLPIVNAPHPALRQVARPVTQVDKKLIRLISDMTRALLSAKDPEGVGLAASQVGVPLRLFLIRPLPKRPVSVFINPEILSYSQRQQTPHSKKGIYEGCLSLPHHYSPLKRSMSITVKYQTIEPAQTFKQNRAQPDAGNDQAVEHDFAKVEPPKLVEKTEVFTGFPAHIIQHEVDHLNGILFIDRTLEQKAKLYRIRGEEWEEIDL